MENGTPTCHYDYAKKCDCSEDDKCGCDYPNNLPHDFSLDCLDNDTQEAVATNAPAFADTTDIPSLNSTPDTTAAFSAGMTEIIDTKAPDFTAPAILNDNTLIKHFNFYKYTENKLSILFFYPEDFSFTCPSELLMLNNEINAFNKRNAKILAISTDSIYSHIVWKELPPEKDGISDISFPLIADLDKKISSAYHILNKKETAIRATFIIDEQKIIRHISLNDAKVWRNPEEIIRIIDILNQKSTDITSCPPGWKQNFPFERPEPESITELYSHNNT